MLHPPPPPSLAPTLPLVPIPGVSCSKLAAPLDPVATGTGQTCTTSSRLHSRRNRQTRPTARQVIIYRDLGEFAIVVAVVQQYCCHRHVALLARTQRAYVHTRAKCPFIFYWLRGKCMSLYSSQFVESQAVATWVTFRVTWSELTAVQSS